MPPPRRCYEVIAAPIFRKGSRPSGCPRPMRRGWLWRNRLNRTLRPFRRVPEGFAVYRPPLPISMVESRSGGLGYSTRRPPEGRPNFFAVLPAWATQDDHRETAKLNGKQRENLGGKERDPLHLALTQD